MMTEVTQLAMRIYTVIDSMLPPSFSVITGAAAAVGQMKQMNMPSKMSFQPGEGAMATSATQMAESATRIPCKMKYLYLAEGDVENEEDDVGQQRY